MALDLEKGLGAVLVAQQLRGLLAFLGVLVTNHFDGFLDDK